MHGTFSDILIGLYSTVNTPELIRETYDRIAQEVGAVGVLGCKLATDGFEIRDVYTSSYYDAISEVLAEYVANYSGFENAIYSTVFSARQFVPVTDLDAWPDETDLFERPDFRFIRQNAGILRRVAFNLSPKVGWRNTVVFHFPEPDFVLPKGAISTASQFVPHIGKVTEIGEFFSALQAKYKAVLSVLDNMNLGICLLDSGGNIVLSNSYADRIFAAGDGIRWDGGRIRLSAATDNARLQEGARSTYETARGENNVRNDSFYANRPSGRGPVYLELSPIRDGRYEIIKDFAGSIVYMIDTDDPPEIDIMPLAQMAGFTQAERQVAQLVCRGLKEREIADIRNVALETVRKQIKTVLAKAGLKSRVQLVTKAVSLKPPVL
jgi:DNA-binding CsgD family transcriptional regulator/PAS domain-containing protein